MQHAAAHTALYNNVSSPYFLFRTISLTNMSDTPNANPASPGGRQIPPWRWLLSFPLQGAHSFQADEVYALLQPHRRTSHPPTPFTPLT